MEEKVVQFEEQFKEFSAVEDLNQSELISKRQFNNHKYHSQIGETEEEKESVQGFIESLIQSNKQAVEELKEKLQQTTQALTQEEAEKKDLQILVQKLRLEDALRLKTKEQNQVLYDKVKELMEENERLLE